MDRKYVGRRLGNGEFKSYLVEVGWKPYLIKEIDRKFGFEVFTLTNLQATTNEERNKLLLRLNSLHKSGWVRKKSKSRKFKDSCQFQLRKQRFDDYIHEFGSLFHGPLVKKKQLITPIERERIVEKRLIDKNRYLGRI